MKKQYLQDTLEKYHLGGLVERVKIEIKNKTLTTNFISIQKNLVGFLESPNIDLPDCEFGIYDTSQLLKLIGITDNFITLDIETKNKITNKILIKDNEFNLEYILADVKLTPSVPIIDEPTYNLISDIDEEFLLKFLKAKKAISSENFSLTQTKDINGAPVLSFTLGDSNYSNKINFDIKLKTSSIPGPLILFPIKEFAEILIANKGFEIGLLSVSEDGLLKIEFSHKENVKSTYLLVGKE